MALRGSFAAARSRGTTAWSGSVASLASASSGSIASGSSRRAQTRSAVAELPASARSVTRSLSHGGAKSSKAAATAAVLAASAAGRGSGRSSSDASAIPSTRNTGTPIAGNVQIQSPDACTVKYASVPSAATPATVSRRPPEADDEQDEEADEQREADDAGLE